MRGSYLVKVLILLLGLVLVLETSSYVATRLVIRDAVTDNARQELQRGGELFTQLMQSKAEQLALSVSVLIDDFGFKEAVATGDAATIRSALTNHTARINADIGVVFDNQFEWVASTLSLPPEEFEFIDILADAAQPSRTVYTSLVISDKPYQFVLSPIRAPIMIGMAGIGFEIEDQFTHSLKRLTGLEVAFIYVNEHTVDYFSGTLDDSGRKELLDTLHTHPMIAGQVIQTSTMMSLLVPLSPEPTGLVAVLQVPLDQALLPFARINTQLLWLALIFSALAALLALLLARSVTQPVSALANVAKRITNGDYDTPVRVQSNDELGDLAQGFTKMQSAIAEREQHIIYQAQHDSLTQLINRGRLFPELEHAIATAQAHQSCFALLAIDIDNFTRINDTLSPEIGDQVLQAVAQRIATHAGETGVAVRLGSDEFALIIQGVDAQGSQHEAHALLARFQPDIRLTALSLNIDINIGLVVYPDDGDQPETLLRRANLALNQSRSSQTRITVYQSGWDERHLRRLALFGELRNALLAGQISLNYQPKIYLANRRHVGAEALVRWQHPELGFVNPEEFIAVAESTGQIGLLTRWVMKTAISQLSQFKAQGYDLRMSVNLSALDLLDNTLPEYIHTLFGEYQLDPPSLCLEITESAIMGEAETSLRNLERLRSLGLVLSIDDFGTGYSSLSQLKKLPVSELKIDKSFIFNLVSNEDDRLIVRSTIELGHTLGLSITAEGVETQDIEQLLEHMGCDTVQGYLYSKALPAAAFQQWLDDYYAQL